MKLLLVPALAALVLLPSFAGPGHAAVALPPEVAALLPSQPGVPCSGPCPNMLEDEAWMHQNFVGTASFSPSSCEVQEGMAPAGQHRLLAFSTSIPNAGPGDLVVGSPLQNPERFTYSTCHGHWHLKSYADYRLWTPENWANYQTLRHTLPQYSSRQLIGLLPDAMKPVSGNKQGFCVIDVLRYPQYGGDDFPHFSSCGFMGISRGWSDVYTSWTPGQWVVVDGLHGTFVLEAEVNAGRFYQETDYLDNSTGIAVAIP